MDIRRMNLSDSLEGVEVSREVNLKKCDVIVW